MKTTLLLLIVLLALSCCEKEDPIPEYDYSVFLGSWEPIDVTTNVTVIISSIDPPAIKRDYGSGISVLANETALDEHLYADHESNTEETGTDFEYWMEGDHLHESIVQYLHGEYWPPTINIYTKK